MGTPKIIIEFLKKSATFIRRSGRGTAVLILEDDTRGQALNPYMGMDEVAEADWTKKNREYIRLAFAAEPRKLLCVRAVMQEGELQLAETLELIRYIDFDYMASPYLTAADGDMVKAFIRKIRSEGKKAKAVLPEYEADCEAVINFATPSVAVMWSEDEEPAVYSAKEYCCRIAGILAAVPLTQSSTYYELTEVVDAAGFDDIDTEIDKGRLVIMFDGSRYKIARGVTSLQTVTDDCPEDFKKIKVVEGADIIRHDIRTTFEEEFVGKLNNTYDNKQQLIGAINQYLKELEDTVVDAESPHYVELDMEAILQWLKDNRYDTDEMTEQQIKEANTGSGIFLAGRMKLLDAVEDLVLKIQL